jgi:hypothetical protein
MAPLAVKKAKGRQRAFIERWHISRTHNTERNKMTTPYELRFATFYQAKELLENNYKASMAAWDLLDKTTKQAAELAPKFPTVAEIIDASLEINKFVSESTQQELTKAAKKITGF